MDSQYEANDSWHRWDNPSQAEAHATRLKELEQHEGETGSYRPQVMLPLILFLATCWSTYAVGGLAFFLGLMTILTAHELGHFFMARLRGIPASYPYFLPMPFSPIGTLGAVIAMQPGLGNRRSLFDIAIAGPIAGLIPAIGFSGMGLAMSTVIERGQGLKLGEPLLFQWLAQLQFGVLDENQDILLHPLAYAGWVGIFITALNLIPIGQLDGGHVLYAIFRERSRPVATLLLLAAAIAVVLFGYWGWTLMILLLWFIGPAHPPTANDSVPLGMWRTVLGSIMLFFPLIGFTPVPFDL